MSNLIKKVEKYKLELRKKDSIRNILVKRRAYLQ